MVTTAQRAAKKKQLNAIVQGQAPAPPKTGTTSQFITRAQPKQAPVPTAQDFTNEFNRKRAASPLATPASKQPVVLPKNFGTPQESLAGVSGYKPPVQAQPVPQLPQPVEQPKEFANQFNNPNASFFDKYKQTLNIQSGAPQNTQPVDPEAPYGRFSDGTPLTQDQSGATSVITPSDLQIAAGIPSAAKGIVSGIVEGFTSAFAKQSTKTALKEAEPALQYFAKNEALGNDILNGVVQGKKAQTAASLWKYITGGAAGIAIIYGLYSKATTEPSQNVITTLSNIPDQIVNLRKNGLNKEADYLEQQTNSINNDLQNLGEYHFPGAVKDINNRADQLKIQAAKSVALIDGQKAKQEEVNTQHKLDLQKEEEVKYQATIGKMLNMSDEQILSDPSVLAQVNSDLLNGKRTLVVEFYQDAVQRKEQLQKAQEQSFRQSQQDRTGQTALLEQRAYNEQKLTEQRTYEQQQKLEQRAYDESIQTISEPSSTLGFGLLSTGGATRLAKKSATGGESVFVTDQNEASNGLFNKPFDQLTDEQKQLIVLLTQG